MMVSKEYDTEIFAIIKSDHTFLTVSFAGSTTGSNPLTHGGKTLFQ